ncbi:FA complementation group M [Cochliomyia hominivorax]
MSKSTTSVNNEEDWEDLGLDDTALQSLLDNPLETSDASRLRDGEHHQGFDNNMGENWIYPNNLPCRSYQMSIVQAALYRNTLVVLPTGLGKTFIAAVVMYNIYRWYPRGKIIFMAPTRPLVNQQIEACQQIMPFPKKDIVELTGKLQRTKRTEMWKTKRVFFATPQVVQSDIFGGRQQAVESIDEYSFQDSVHDLKTEFPFDQVKLIVIDEAHKAKGKYAYTEVVQTIVKKSKYFRVLALSATPGRTIEDVAEVCRNLLISHLEVRWDTSIDVLPYIHKRSMDTVVVSMGDKIKEIREQLLLIVDPYLRQLTEAEVLSGSLTNINRNFLLYEQKRFRDRSFHYGHHPQHSAITSNFAICISLYHALELLERHGLRVFLNNFEEDDEGKGKFVLQMDRRLYNLVEKLKKEMGPNPFDVSAAPMTNGKIAEIPKDLDFGHPKFEKTRECLLKHFQNNEDSRAIVFCEYRESVMLIYRMLLQHVPLLKPRCFVGQGGTTGPLRALTQKQQIQIMNDFRSGKSNILIATSIGEEGIDVGEVELIVCFDISTSNPTRFVQRIGRTGRQKNGYVIMMVTEGREQQLLREVLSNKDQINKKLLRSHVIQQSLYKHSPRLVPTELKPKCLQTFIKPPTEGDDSPSPKGKKVANNKLKTPEKGVQDLRKFFQKKTTITDKKDSEFFEDDTTMTQARPGVQTQQKIVNKLDKMKNLFKDLQLPMATHTQKSPRKVTNKSNCSQGSIKDYFKDSSMKSQLHDSINLSQTSVKELNESTTIDLCDDSDKDKSNEIEGSKSDKDSFDQQHTESVIDFETFLKQMDPERLQQLEAFLKTTHTTPEVLKRAEISDLGYHLKSKELSREMKTLFLRMHPEYIKENFEKMEILKALYDNDDISSYTEEEKSIREIYEIIIDLFGGLEKTQQFLDEQELEEFKKKYLESDSEEEEEDPEEMDNFRKKLDNIFEGLGDGKEHDNYEWIQERFKQTRYYKDQMQSKVSTQVQESMVYETFVEPEEERILNDTEDYSIIESKYCSQWQEFNKKDITFKSTPVQGTTNKNTRRGEDIKKTSLLSRLEETVEEHETLDFPNTSFDSKNIQNALEMLEQKLKGNSLNESPNCKPQDDLEELENMFKTKRTEYELRRQQYEEYKSSTTSPQQDKSADSKTSPNNFEDFNLPDEDDLIMAAAAEAELIYTQNKSKQKEKDFTTTSIGDPNKTPDLPNIANSSAKLTPPSLNSTPELDLSHNNLSKLEKPTLTSALPTPPDVSLQQELDIDMEAFMDPFPEEQELLKPTQSTSERRERFKENITSSTTVRESPDLFAEEHLNSPIKKPLVCKKPSLASKLSSKVNLQKRQSIFNPTSSSALFKSPEKTICNIQNTAQLLKSPSTRLPTNKEKYEKSPSLFDMYMKNTKGKGKLPKSLVNHSTFAACSTSVNLANVSNNKNIKESPVIPASQQNESLIVVRNRSGKASKRKIFDSDSEQEEDVRNVNRSSVLDSRIEEEDEDDSDFEQVAATQGHDESSIIQQRKKRRRFNSFIEHEAGVSGSEQSEDEADHTIGCYMLDSVVVPSDEEDPDQASTSHMQAMYLQSLKSPQQKRGAFKIPAPRVYNDHSRIFSQAVLPDDTYSQYLPDSFVVEGEDSFINDNADVTEVSMCPLEKAEKILKERRRAKKLGLLEEDKPVKTKTKTKNKRIQIIESSSDDDFE